LSRPAKKNSAATAAAIASSSAQIETKEPQDALPSSSSSSSSNDEGIVVWLAYMYTGNVKYIMKHDKFIFFIFICYNIFMWYYDKLKHP